MVYYQIYNSSVRSMIKSFKTADWAKIILEIKKDILTLLKNILYLFLMGLLALIIIFVFTYYTLIGFSILGILILLLALVIYIDNKVITFQK